MQILKTRCKSRDRGVKLLLPRAHFPTRGFAVLATSGQLRPVNYLINSKGEFSVHRRKSRNREIITGSSDSIRGGWRRWHENVGQMSSTQTNGPAEGRNLELSECLWKASGVSLLLLLLLQRSSWCKEKKFLMEAESCEAAAFVKFMVPVFKPRSHRPSCHFYSKTKEGKATELVEQARGAALQMPVFVNSSLLSQKIFLPLSLN